MVLSISDLVVEFGHGKAAKRVIHGVSLEVGEGEIVALVGESGSGKTTIGRAVMGAIVPVGGEIVLNERPVRGRTRTQRRQMACDVQMVFQNPYGSLNPAMPVGRSIGEPLLAQGEKRETIVRRVESLIQRVGLPRGSENRYPSSFSGGERQRISIARALSVSPRLVVCDEPTSALDVSTQKRVLDLLLDLRDELRLSYLFISHDLAVVSEIADRVLVLRDGRIVEEGTAAQVCTTPTQPYTRQLVASVPVPDPVLQRQRRTALANRIQMKEDL